MVRPLYESQGSSPLQGHGSWLLCKVALTQHLEEYREHTETNKENLKDVNM